MPMLKALALQEEPAMVSRVLRRLLPAALLALPVLGGLWATSGPATLAAP